jgi:hypothetical protein
LPKKSEDNAVVGLIWEMYRETKDARRLVNDGLRFSSDIVLLLFKQHKNNIGAEDLNNIVKEIMQSPQFAEDKNDFAFGIACEIFALYIKDSNCPECVVKLFNQSLLNIEKGNSFSDKSVKKFETILSNEECKKAFFSINFNSWSRPEKQRIYKFLQVLEKKNMLDLSADEMQTWLEKPSFGLQDRSKVIEPTFKKLKSTVADAAHLIDTLENNITKKDEEYQKQLNKINENYRIIDNRDKELSNLKSLLNRKNVELESLRNEQIRLKSEMESKEKRLETMTNEIGQFSQVAVSAKNDEMFALKNDIKNALQDEYNKYMETREASCSEDLFEAFKGRFFRIFTTLKRFEMMNWYD